jgi:hypothetical protein
MAKTTDVVDPVRQDELTEIERLLDEGEYTEVVRRSADFYQRLVTVRPDLIIEARRAELTVSTAGRPPRPPFAPWPGTLGVTLTFDDAGRPVVTFEKDSFMMSTAITYFEYALEAAVRAQKEAP